MQPRLFAACAFLLLAALPLSALEVPGFVYDMSGKPIGGARVSAFVPESTDARIQRWMSPAPERRASAGAVSDSSGAFRLADLPDAVFEIQVRAAGFAPVSQYFLPGDTTMTFSLEPAAEVGGRIIGKGKPVKGATVVWMRAEETEITTITDSEGRYSAPDPAVWATTVAVFDPDFAPRYSPNERVRAEVHEISLDAGRKVNGRIVGADAKPVGEAVILADRLPIGRSGEDGVFDITRAPHRFRRLSAIKGSLQGVAEVAADGTFLIRLSPAKEIEGTVRLRDGNRLSLLPRAPVLIREITGDSEGVIVVADGNGHYVLDGLGAGRYGIFLPPPLESRIRADYSERMALEDLGPNFVDLRTSAKAGHDLDLFRPAVVWGRVTDRNGKPVAGAAVVLVAAETPNVELGVDRNGPRTAADGTFRIPIVWVDGPQKLEVRVVRSGHSNARSAAFSIVGAREIRADVVLLEETAVTVRVVDESGKPIGGARTMFGAVEQTGDYRSTSDRLLHPGQQGALITSSTGEVTLGLQPGEYDFAASAEGFQARAIPARMIGRAPLTVTIALPAAVAISGRVVRNGQGVPDVHVHASNIMRDAPLMTGADGSFVLGGLAPGEYELMFMKPGEMVEERRQVTAPSARLVVELPPSGAVSGVIVDAESGKPVSQFGITIQKEERRGRRPMHQMIRGSDGRFEFPSVPAGEVRLIAAAEGYLPSDPLVLQVEAGKPLADVRIALDRGATIAGTVTDDRGRPLQEARVAIAPADPNSVEMTMEIRMGPAATTTDAAGEFILQGVRPGNVTVAVSRSGFLGARRDVQVDRSARLDVQLERGLSITGIVRSGGRPVEGAQIGATTAAAGAEYQTATTDSSGRFTLHGLLPAIYTISAFKEELRHRELKGVDPQTQREVVIDLDTEERSVITGRVLGMPRPGSGEKITFARVSAIGTDHGAEATIEPSGGFRINDAPSGVVRLVAQVQIGRETRTTPERVIEVSAGAETQVDLEFATALTISGRVSRAGAPVAAANVVFSRPNGPAASAITDEDGRYSAPLPEEGVYRVFVHGTSESARHEAVHTFTSSGTLDIDLREIEVAGLVIDAATRAPIARAIVSVFPANAPSSGAVPPPFMQTTSAARMLFTETMVDPDGRFTLKIPAGGRYEIVASAPGYAQASRPVAGGEQVLELSHAEALSVRVIDAQRGTPLDAHVIVRDASDRTMASRPERRGDGSVAFSVAPGRYIVTAVAPGYAQRSVPATAPGTVEIAVSLGGNVLIESKEPLQGRVIVRDSAGVAAIPCCEGGEWALTGTRTFIQQLMPGSYTAELLDFQSARIASISFAVRAGETVRVSVP